MQKQDMQKVKNTLNEVTKAKEELGKELEGLKQKQQEQGGNKGKGKNWKKNK